MALSSRHMKVGNEPQSVRIFLKRKENHREGSSPDFPWSSNRDVKLKGKGFVVGWGHDIFNLFLIEERS